MFDDSALHRIGRTSGRFRSVVALFALLVSAVLLAVVNHVDSPDVADTSVASAWFEVAHVTADAGVEAEALVDDTGLAATGVCALVAICCLLLLSAARTWRRSKAFLSSRRPLLAPASHAPSATAPAPDLLLLSISRT
ncbi:MAG: hypothetical protein AB7K08_04560 [Microbacteriaceae bacterium]|jgi:hypothetical protein